MTRRDQYEFYWRAITYFFLTGWSCLIVIVGLKVFHEIGWL